MTEIPKSSQLTYADAGVDIAAGNALVRRIKPLVAQTHRAGVLGSIGGFGGFFELPTERYRQPVMVSGTDGVGTKLRLAIELNLHDTIGIDLVAMCVNDVLVCGAEPLWFMDYLATSKLNVDQATRVVSGIAQGCKLAGAALLGGETAEMPGMYQPGDYDLAGFAVGVVEKDQIINGASVQAGDAIVGIASSGPHSNGYSLINHLLKPSDLDQPLGGATLGNALLAPTRIYVKPILDALQWIPIKAMAHITGGGLTENLPRVLPANMTACIHRSNWQMPAVFAWIQSTGGVADSEMFRTFNCGIGMALVVSQEHVAVLLDSLKESGETATLIGEVANQVTNSHTVSADPAVMYID